MRRVLAVVLLFVLLLTFAPSTAADETLADCEPDQPWVGYGSTDPARAIVQPALAGHGLVLEACEGEQWDGQDGVAPTADPGCSGPAVEPDPARPSAALCQGADPNAASGEDPLNPLRLRASANGQEAYASWNVVFLSRGAVYVGTCSADGPGLEGAASCGGTRELRTGVYLRDNTVGNLVARWLVGRCLFSVIPECGLGEFDCSQAVYQYGAYSPPSQCARDNTAIGLAIVLP